jgi:deoxyribose-phosphate aldolase
MNRAELARRIDHSVLKPDATEADIHAGAAIVRAWSIGFYCVQPYWVRAAAAALAGTDARIVTVAGFPHGCDRAEVKAHAAALAVAEGAAEVDMVQNFGALKSGHASIVAAEIEAVVRAVPGISVKVILETAMLTAAEKVCLQARARCRGGVRKDFNRLSSAGGATVADVRAARRVRPGHARQGFGRNTELADALAMIDAGADRLGVSASVAILEALSG